MVDPLHIDAAGMLSRSEVHGAVSEALRRLHPGDISLDATHGAVASPVSSALTAALGRRSDILQSTATSGQQIAELLQGAAEAYRVGDEEAGRQLLTAAQAIEPGMGSAAAAAPVTAPAAPAAPSGADAGAGQLGQVLGQIVQSVTQPIQGLVQALGQVPASLLGGSGGFGALGEAAQIGGPVDHPSADRSEVDPADGGDRADAAHAHAHEQDRSHGDRADPSAAAEPKQPTSQSSPAATELNAAPPVPPRRPASTRPQD